MENTAKSAEIKEVETQLKEFQDLADTFHGHIREVIAITQLAAKQDVNEDGEDEADMDHGRGRAKPDLALRPERLTQDFTPDEFREWQELISSYFEASNFEAVSVTCQQQYLKACLNLTLKLRLSEKIDKRTPVFGN